jgi:transposase-like protein
MNSPPFCPNAACRYHQEAPPGSSWYVRNGHYRSASRGAIQRYRCRACGTGFSAQTFSLDYMARRAVNYTRLFELLVSSSGIRDMARILKVSPHCITNRISRLSRQAMAVHSELLATLHLREELVADGLESFAVSQYFPNNIQLLAGKQSQYWICSDYAHLKRKGRMRGYQRRRNSSLQQQITHHRRTIYRSFEAAVQQALILTERSPYKATKLFTDEHRQYRRVMDSLSCQERSLLPHRTISSKKARTLSNPLFTVNYLERQIRKDLAEHSRETVQFARNVVNQMERLAVYRLYHNYFKPFRINGREDRHISHGQRAGISLARIAKELKSLFTRRRFYSRLRSMMISDRRLWLKGIATPLKRGAEYLPAYCWA